MFFSQWTLVCVCSLKTMFSCKLPWLKNHLIHSKGKGKGLGTLAANLWWWRPSSHCCRCEEVADEIEEQGDILRYPAAVLTLMTSPASLCVQTFGDSASLTSQLQWDCMHSGSHAIHPTNKTSLMLLQHVLATQPPAHLSDSRPFCHLIRSCLLQWTSQTNDLYLRQLFLLSHTKPKPPAHQSQVWGTCRKKKKGKGTATLVTDFAVSFRCWRLKHLK